MSKQSDGLKPLPKPIRLDAPKGDGGARPDGTPRREPPKRIPPPDNDLRYFEQAQRSHGARRPVPKKVKKPRQQFRYSKEVGIACLGLLCLGFIVFGIILLTSDNALAVYLDEQRVGFLPLNRETREWDADYVQAQAVAHREASVAAEIVVTEQVHLRRVRANRRYLTHATITEVISQVSQGFSYQIVATAIYIDGQRIALLRSQGLADFVEQHFTGAFDTSNTLEASIVGWELRTLVVPDEGLNTADFAITYLDRPIETTIPYTVRDGDTKGVIALRNGIPLSRLLEDNNLAPDAIIRPGDIINIRTTRPFVTVRTIEQETRTEVIPKEIDTREDDTMAIGDVRVISEGRDGERNLIVRITRENGTVISEEVISATMTITPETRIVEVGTSPTAVPMWRG